MTKEIALILLAKISNIPYLERQSGIVQVVEKTVLIDGEKPYQVTLRIPITSFASFENCNTSQAMVAMIPDSSFKGMVYFEDGGTGIGIRQRGSMAYQSSLRMVCWLNTNLISGSPNMLLSASMISDILKRLVINPFNSAPFSRISIAALRVTQDRSIFSKYAYSEAETQYLMSPFEYFAIDFSVKFEMPFECASPVVITDNPNTCL